MRIFFSHSGRDRACILPTVNQLQQSGIDVYAFEHDTQPGAPVIAKIQEALSSCDVMVVFITRQSANAPWVQQEIGWALRGGTLVIPVVEDLVDRETTLAMLDGLEYIQFNSAEPQRALDALKAHLIRTALQDATIHREDLDAYQSRQSATQQFDASHTSWTPPLLSMSLQLNVPVIVGIVGVVGIILCTYMLYSSLLASQS